MNGFLQKDDGGDYDSKKMVQPEYSADLQQSYHHDEG